MVSKLQRISSSAARACFWCSFSSSLEPSRDLPRWVGEVVLNLPEAGVLAQEYPQLVLHGLRLLLHLPHRPAVHVPAQVDHAVLLEQVVVKFVLGDQLRVVGGLVVDLNGHLPPAVFDQEVGKPAVLVDVGEGVLGVEIVGFLGTKGVGEQFNEQILGTAAGGGGDR